MGAVPVILLDTNYLIRALVAGTLEAGRVSSWFEQGESLCTSSIAWCEFLSGPVDDDGIDLIRTMLQDRILPFVKETAAEAARLFNSTGSNRRLRVDAMIAASSIIEGARLATENETDFTAFTTEGLQLV